MSVAYYNANAASYFEATARANVSSLRERFIAHLPHGGKVLDAGCGSGRDAKAFLAAGFDVSAFDGSAEMVQLAREHTGLPVALQRFEQLEFYADFDGVWACASLLHVARENLPDVFQRINQALRSDGVFYASFKHGTDTRNVDGRVFTDLEESELTKLCEASGFMIAECWLTDDVRPGRNDRWLNALLVSG